MNEEKDELNIDFYKIKRFIKEFFLRNNTINSDTENPSLKIQEPSDFKKARELLTKHKTAAILIVLLILQFTPNLGFLPWGGMQMRLEFENLPLSEKQATEIVYKNYLQQIYSSVNAQQPNLPPSTKQALAQQELNKVFDSDNRIKQDIQKVATAIKTEYSYSSSGRQYTFMPDIDSYYYLRLADNVLKRGHAGDTKKDRYPWDNHAVAPIGANVSIQLHPYTLAAMHKIAKAFNPKITLMQSAAYFPLLMTLIVLVILFFIGKNLNGHLGGLITATLYSLNYAAFTKTMWGMADTDAYNLMLPALFILFFTEALQTKQRGRMLSFILASSLTIAVYAFAWSGWWYILHLSTATIVIYSAYLFRTERENKNFRAKVIKTQAQLFFCFIIFTILFTSISLSYREFGVFSLAEGSKIFANQLLGPLSFSKINLATRIDLWPNVYTTVAELQRSSFNDIIAQAGGWPFAFVSLIGLLILLRKDKTTPNHIIYGIFLLLLIISGIYATLKGRRFILLMIVPVTISAGYAITYLYKKIRDANAKGHMRVPAIILLFLILIFLNTGNIVRANYWIENITPQMNAAWWQSLNDIKRESQKNAIITSWWDFGHQITYVADRAVTFDGASQNTPMAYWVGKTLSTSDENEALGILRMLACGSNNAYKETYRQTDENIFKSIKIVSELTKIGKREDAKKYLEKEEFKDTESILKYTHCNPPENYFITSEDMRNKAGVWSHFGGWNFERAYALQVLKNKPLEEATEYITKNFNSTLEEATTMYETMQTFDNPEQAENWLAPVLTYSQLRSCQTTTNAINCNGILVNTKTHEATIKQGDDYLQASNVAFVDETTGKFTNKILNENAGSGIIVFPSGTGGYYGLPSSPELTTSIFTRLIYFDGHGLKHFKLFTKRKLPEGGFVTVWKIDWNGTAQNIMPALQTKKEAVTDSLITFNSISWLENGEIIDSTITNWKTLNITKDANFDDYPTEPRVRKIGSKQMIPQFEQAIIGMKINETTMIKINAQDILASAPDLLEKLGNRTITFKIKIEKIR